MDLTRQALAKYANQVFLKVIEGYQHNVIKQVTFYSRHFLGLVGDLDTLLSSHDGFLLGPCLESAKGLAKDSEQEKQVVFLAPLYKINICKSLNIMDVVETIGVHGVQFEWNARTQITMWFDNTETEASLLHDYGT